MERNFVVECRDALDFSLRRWPAHMEPTQGYLLERYERLVYMLAACRKSIGGSIYCFRLIGLRG